MGFIIFFLHMSFRVVNAECLSCFQGKNQNFSCSHVYFTNGIAELKIPQEFEKLYCLLVKTHFLKNDRNVMAETFY